MSNCSNHRKDVHGETDMKHLAEEVGNLHYETLHNFLGYLGIKLYKDCLKDRIAGRETLGYALLDASDKIKLAATHIKDAWSISKPFMESKKMDSKNNNEDDIPTYTDLKRGIVGKMIRPPHDPEA